MHKNISITQALELRDSVMIDVRSEGEYAEDTIPGAENIPLLDNEERARVGIAYKNEGTERARRLGLAIVSPKLVGMINTYDQAVKSRKLVVFCWRGGQRSEFTASLLASMGFNVYRLEGGYKAYRRYVNDYLGRDILPHKVVVLYGLTGVGKTTIIHKLRNLGVPALDLEGIAKHRGSVFGKIGLPPSPTQKKFESQITDTLRQCEKDGLFVIECESKRIGNLTVPPVIMNSMADGHRVLLYAPLETRVRRILEEYTVGPGDAQSFREPVTHLKQRLGSKKVSELIALLDENRLEEVFHYLVETYYDKLYGYPGEPSGQYDLSVDCTDLEEATIKIKEYVAALGNV